MRSISIKTKLIFYISALFVFIGTLIYITLSNTLPQRVTAQILKRDAKLAEYIANDAKDNLLVNDNLSLSLLLHDNLDRLEDAKYLFVQAPDGRVISHTFEKGVPRGLLSLRAPRSGAKQSPSNIKELVTSGRKIYDIAVPIFGGELGILHLGVSLESSKLEIAEFARLNYYVVVIIFVGLGIGILAFSFMADNLKQKMEEIRRLSYLEERNRIAIEFHDVLASDLANIIKRTELCERLFKIDKDKAFTELEDIRENTKAVLDKTRKFIMDLKSPAEADFNLLSSLNGYIEDYELLNGIDIDLDISGFTEEIQPDKARSIYYLITEALTNVKKHSSAKNVWIKLQFSDEHCLNIDIKDDGRGFDTKDAELLGEESGKYGLVNMRHRAVSLGGTFAIESLPDKGARICATVPIKRCQF